MGEDYFVYIQPFCTENRTHRTYYDRGRDQVEGLAGPSIVFNHFFQDFGARSVTNHSSR